MPTEPYKYLFKPLKEQLLVFEKLLYFENHNVEDFRRLIFCIYKNGYDDGYYDGFNAGEIECRNADVLS